MLFNVLHTPYKGSCGALWLVAEVSAAVPFECCAVVAKLHLHQLVLHAHAVAYLLHTLVAAVFLFVAKTKIHALCLYGVSLCVDVPTFYP